MVSPHVRALVASETPVTTRVVPRTLFGVCLPPHLSPSLPPARGRAVHRVNMKPEISNPFDPQIQLSRFYSGATKSREVLGLLKNKIPKKSPALTPEIINSHEPWDKITKPN